MSLWQALAPKLEDWRESNYKCDDYPAIAEILRYQRHEDGSSRYLRIPQIEALEMYWFIRLVLKTPRLLDLYKVAFDDRQALASALGVRVDVRYADIGKILDDAVNDSHVAKEFNLEHIIESLQLDYPSYIMALTMGTGKTVLIGGIIASEFAMSIEYPDGNFMKNALVFAPGTTIIGSLKELSDVPYAQILPPRFYKKFLANLKITYAQTGSKTIQIDQGGTYHVVVTNTEKIILKKPARKKNQTTLEFKTLEEQYKLTENQRLAAIKSLPNLGIFSDEAQNTYGSKLDEELKRVRATIDYLHAERNLVCVVNTTGTPYVGTKTLPDVVYWYGLSKGIEDGILKSLTNSIISYDFDDTPPEEVFDDVIKDFFKEYGSTTTVNGSKSKIAFYFKNQEHLEESRPRIEEALAEIGESPSIILMNTQQSNSEELNEFARLNDPASQKRVILLVSKGKEGWNCPSLFACALIRQLTSSNNFILQASARCLRQVEGNSQPARIYIEVRNQRVLNDELSKTESITLSELSKQEPKNTEVTLVFRKTKYPELELTRKIETIVGRKGGTAIELTKPKKSESQKVFRSVFSPTIMGNGVILTNSGEEQDIAFNDDVYDQLTAATLLAQNYHLKPLETLQRLKKVYGDADVPRSDLEALYKQVEGQLGEYEVTETTITQALALIKFVDDDNQPVMRKNESGQYCHTIRIHDSQKKNIVHEADERGRNNKNLGFHYTPYNFDSEPEKLFLEEMLDRLQTKTDEVTDIYFTGGLTNKQFTDLYFEYKKSDGSYHAYFPDFVIVKKDGSFLMVEVKAKGKEQDEEVLTKARAVQKREELPENRFKYHILYTETPIATNKLVNIVNLIEEL